MAGQLISAESSTEIGPTNSVVHIDIFQPETNNLISPYKLTDLAPVGVLHGEQYPQLLYCKTAKYSWRVNFVGRN